MKIKILPLLLLTLLVGCTQDLSSSENISESSGSSETQSESGESSFVDSSAPSSEDVVSSEDTTSQGPESSEDVTSVPPSSSEDGTSTPPTSGEPEPEKTYSNLSEIKALGETLFSKVNAVGVYTSTYYAEFTAQLLSVQDYITTQSGYTARYKILVANATGHLSVSITGSTIYNNIKKYHENQQVYDFKGYIGVYNNEVEVVMDSFGAPVYRAGVTLDYDYKPSATRGTSIQNFISKVKALKHNSKGITWSPEITVYKLKYIAKTDDTQALFTDGYNVISVHSHDKLNNGFSINSVYDVYGREGLFNFKPSFEYVGHTKLTDTIEFSYADVATETTVAKLGVLRYDLDKLTSSKNFEYTDSLINFYYFEGYANCYTTGQNDFVVFDDTAKDYYGTLNRASDAKALFAKNDSCTSLNGNDWSHCPFLGYYDDLAENKVKVSFYFAPYQYNTDPGQYSIFVFEGTINRVL